MPKQASRTKFWWPTGRLVGSDPATATKYRCMVPDCDDKCFVGKLRVTMGVNCVGKLRVTINHHSTMHYVMLLIANR